MFEKNKKGKRALLILAIFLFAEFFILTEKTEAGVWVDPTLAPPAGNTYQPVTIGPSEFSMTGTLTIGATNYLSNPYEHGLIVSQGVVSIGSTNPSYDFEVRQPIGGSTYFGALPSESPLLPEFGFDVRYSTASFANPVFVGTPIDGGHAVTKNYLDTAISNIGFWDENTANEIYNTNTGINVGIGTNNPFERLDVDGVIRAGNASSVAGSLILAGQYSGSNYLNTFGGQYSSGATTIGYATRPKSGTNGYVSSAGNSSFTRSALELATNLRFFTGSAQTVAIGSDVAMTERFTILNNGNIGIGSNDPAHKLDVQGSLVVDTQDDSGVSALFVTRTGAETQGLKVYANDRDLYMRYIEDSGEPSPGRWRFINEQSGGLSYQFMSAESDGNVLFNGGGNVGIGTDSPGAMLDVSDTIMMNDIPLDESFDYDDMIYFAPQAYFEAESPSVPDGWSWNINGYQTVNDTSIPFSKAVLSNNFDQIVSDYIPVQAGERLYGEVWAMRESGATGDPGRLYYGIMRFDKDKNPISSNSGITYFVASNVTIPTNSVWNKWSGYTNLPTSHTPYNGSDGGPVRYVRVIIYANYNSGTIPTYWGGVLLRRATIFRDTGEVSFMGDLGIGTTSTGGNKLRVEGSGYFSSPVTVATPTGDAHAATKKYVDDQFAGGGAGENFWTESGSEIYNNNSGNVGIGTVPSSAASYGLQLGVNTNVNNGNIDYVNQLHFNDNVRLYDDGNNQYLNFRYGSGGSGGIRFYDGGNNFQGTIYAAGDNENFGILDSDSNWALQIDRDDFIGFRVDNSEVMRMLSGGLGIGTASVGADRLRVEGSGYFASTVTLGTPINDDHAATKKYVDDTSAAGKSFSITVGGDADTYYPVYWWGNSGVGSQTVVRNIQIYRNYNWTAPDTWNTATHRGALNLSFSTNFGNWGGTAYGIQTHRWEETYSSMVGGLRLGANNRALVIWLRGGGARYDMFAVESNLTTPTILYSCGNIGSSSDNVCDLPSPDTSMTPNLYKAISPYGQIRAESTSNHYILGDLGVGTTNPAGSKLRVEGNVYINGELSMTGADVAEEFTTDKIYPAGTVLVMDDKGWKSAKASERKNDSTVVGVISDMASIVMGKVESKYKATVAMVGVVRVKVNASNGQIKKGDLLVTSNLYGEAMRADNPRIGTVIGKAMENADGFKDEIMVLINLQ